MRAKVSFSKLKTNDQTAKVLMRKVLASSSRYAHSTKIKLMELYSLVTYFIDNMIASISNYVLFYDFIK